jgi:phosphoglucomutase
MATDPRAGKPATPDMLVNVPRLITAYYALKPDPAEPAQRVSFGTSGHRGSPFSMGFNEDHILAISQAICEYRKQQGTPVRFFWRWTRTRCRSRRLLLPLKSLPPMGWRS